MLNINKKDTPSHALFHYEMIKKYTEEAIDFYIDVFEILNGKIVKSAVLKTLYSRSFFSQESTVNSFINAIIKYEYVGKGKNKKASRITTANKSIVKRLLNSKNKKLDSNIKKYRVRCLNFFKELKQLNKDIIISDPSTLLKIESRLRFKYKFIKHNVTHGAYKRPIKLILEKIYDYKKFSSKQLGGLATGKVTIKKWERYDLLQLININSCSFCNANYTFTVINLKGKGVVGPQLDHFFDKGTRPLFALSFYNLIPSCSNCNTGIKGQMKFNIKDYIHPYISGVKDEVMFTYNPLDANAAYGKSGNIKIIADYSKAGRNKAKIENSIKTFNLELLYSQHSEFIREMIYKKEETSDSYIDILKRYYPGLVNKDLAYKIAFGNYYQDKDFHKRPLAKLTKDIVRQLGMVK